MDYTKHWDECLKDIEGKISEQAFQTWFTGVAVSAVDDNTLTLQVPNQFHFEWLESKYRTLIDEAVSKNFGKALIINYSVLLTNKNAEEIPKLEDSINQQASKFNVKSKLNNRYTFNNFIEGASNQFAKAAANSVAESPGQTPFNPLLVYSNPGLGKTHLIQAIGNQIISSKPNCKVIYLTSERFMLDFISSIQKNQTNSFINKYRKVDILIIDDIQFFQSKEQTQEQFFHLFNDLFQQGKQIVLTSDRHPNELTDLQSRLISRFSSGLVVDIQPPDLETRIAILMKKAKDEQLEIPYEITEIIATTVKNDIRAMEGALIKLLAISSLNKKDISIDLTRTVLKSIMGNELSARVTFKRIIDIAAKEMKITQKQILGKQRSKDIARARQVVMYLTRELTDLPLSLIGKKIGNRDHATVIHGHNKIHSECKKDTNFSNLIGDIIDKINGI